MVVLVTDGKSQDDAGAAGRVLKGLDVDVFTVGEQPGHPGRGLPPRLPPPGLGSGGLSEPQAESALREARPCSWSW